MDGSDRGAQARGTIQRMDDAFTLLRQAVALLPEELRTEDGGRQSAFSGDGRLRPLWDIGNRTAGGERQLDIARLWVEFAEGLGPGGTADVRLAPLRPGQWRHLRCGDVITMHEARPAVGTA